MKKELSQKLKINKNLSVLTILIGTMLLIYMVIVEDEPGAVPLFLILTGVVWSFITRYHIKKNLRS